MYLSWYYYLSYWIFIWFILYQLEIIKYSPYLAYRVIFIYIIIKISIELLDYMFINKQKIKNYSTLFGILLLIIIIDIVPLLYLKKQIDKQSTIFTLILTINYILFMISQNINIIELYTNIIYIKISNKYTLKKLMYYIFNF